MRLTNGQSVFGSALLILGGIAAGAAIMYIMDPSLGRGRRAFLAQKSRRVVRRSGEFIAGKSKDLSNRARGLVHQTRKAITGTTPAMAAT